MKRVNTRGIQGANKHVLMAAISYNLQKYLHFNKPDWKTEALSLRKSNKRARNSLKIQIENNIFIRSATRYQRTKRKQTTMY